MSKRRITPSLVISVLALIIAIGGVSYAAIKIPKNSVGTKQLKRKAVSTAKIKRGAVATSRLKAGAVTRGKLRGNSVNSAKVRDGSLYATDFAPGQLPGTTWHVARSDEPALLPLTSSYDVIVSTGELPAGSYVISGRANLVGSAVASRIICSLASDAAQNITIAASGTIALSMESTAVLGEAGPIELRCSKSAGSPKVAQAHVIATQVPTVIELTR